MVINFLVRLGIWLLLTADFSAVNLFIGSVIAVLLPGLHVGKETLQEWKIIACRILKAIPQAYVEAIEIMFYPHNSEEITRERVGMRKSPRLVFLEIFLITFTPKTIVLNYHKRGWYKVHKLQPSSQKVSE